MDNTGITFEVIKRGTAKGRLWQEYLDFGWISKYIISKKVCVDFELPNETQYAALAVNTQGKAVGGFKFHFDPKSKTLSSAGTWVAASVRKRGVGTGLWRAAVEKLKVEVAEVTVVSDRGLTLVTSLTKEFPDVSFEMKESADRKLRVLKKKAA